jgi:hypothetical protein
VNSPESADYRRALGIFLTKTPLNDAPKHLPLYTRLRSGHRLLQRPSRQKQTPNNRRISFAMPKHIVNLFTLNLFMRLHRYFATHADRTLAEGRLKFAQVSSFNDPFEFVYTFSGSCTLEQAEEILKHMPHGEIQDFLSRLDLMESVSDSSPIESVLPIRRLAELFVKNGGRLPFNPFHCHKLADKNLVLLCFSKTDIDPKDEILLWSHYARSHCGVRIEFELDEKTLPLQVVEYAHTRYLIDLVKSEDLEYTNQVLQNAFRTKAASWSYEHEVRLILRKECAQKHPIPLGYRYYLPFEPASVRSVDFGINCDMETISTICRILKKGYPHVIPKRGTHHDQDYLIEFRPFEV